MGSGWLRAAWRAGELRWSHADVLPLPIRRRGRHDHGRDPLADFQMRGVPQGGIAIEVLPHGVFESLLSKVERAAAHLRIGPARVTAHHRSPQAVAGRPPKSVRSHISAGARKRARRLASGA